MLPVPRSWAEVTPAWMTAALARAHPGVVVRRVEVGPVAHGTNAHARVVVEHAEGAGPTSVYVKRSGRLLNRLALTALGALGTEARLAACGIPLPVERPAPLAAAVDRRRLATVVVLEDVTAAGARPADGTTPLGVEAVRAGLAGLARLHAAYWDRPLPPALGFLRPWRLGSGWAAVSTASLARGMRRLSRYGMTPVHVSAALLGRQFSAWARLAVTGPQTVLHGDPHLANTYAVAGGGTGFLDWQLARTGNWSHDVGYFVVSSLGTDDRREHERDLLRSYLEMLSESGVAAPGWAVAWDSYRATPAFGLATWLHTLSFGTFQPVGVSVAAIGRFAAAYADLGTGRSAVADGLAGTERRET